MLDSSGDEGMTKERCVVVLSGGPDSAVVAFWAKSHGYEVYALSFKYGQIASKELDSAQKIAEMLEADFKIIDLSSLKEIFSGVSSLVDRNIPMTSAFSSQIVVPFRNAIFLSVAVSYCIGIEGKKVFYGAQGSDRQFYPDCRREFYKAFETSAILGTGTNITVEAPFSETSKPALFRLGLELGVPFDLTWSCYLDGPRHCGKCESCMNRAKAFREAGIPDPTQYDS